MPRINDDDTMIARMEADLVAKVTTALSSQSRLNKVSVHGVFSLDDLERKQAEDLCNEIGVGVGYLSAISTSEKSRGTNLNVDQGNAAAMVEFRFVIVLAVPTDETCGTRYNATQLLSCMRRSILGSKIENDLTNRTWRFISENPDISASTKQMLYYAQVWQVALPNSGGN